MHRSPVKSLRQFVRIPFHGDVRLKHGDQTLAVQLLDISLKGALLECKDSPAIALQDTCRLQLPMAEDGAGITMAGRVVHLDGNQVGIEITEIDVTSLTRLRRLIELNSGDPQLMHREILHLFGRN